MNFDLPNHDIYVLYFDNGIEETYNSDIYKYYIIFILEHLVKNFGLFSPYKQLQRIDCIEQCYNYGNRNIQSIPQPSQNVNVNNYMSSLSPISILPNNIQTPNFSFSSNNSNINYPTNNASYSNSNFTNNNNVINNNNRRY
jgi:hypothetical protein